jgi:hypothetical protein
MQGFTGYRRGDSRHHAVEGESRRNRLSWLLRGLLAVLLPLAALRPALAADAAEPEFVIEGLTAAADLIASGEDPYAWDTADRRNIVLRTIDAVHAGLSMGVEASARRVDGFFADERFYDDSTRTFARVRSDTVFETDGRSGQQARVNVRLDLPGTERRLRLIVESDGLEEDTGQASDTFRVREALDDNSYNIGLESEIEGKKWILKPAIGLKSGDPVDLFGRIRAIRYQDLGTWLMRYSATALHYLDDGPELGTRLDFDRVITPEESLFRSSTEVVWRDEDSRIEAIQRFAYFRKLSRRAALAHEAGVRVDDDPNWDVKKYFLLTRFRYRAYRKWLFVELTPAVEFRDEDNYSPTGVFTLRVDAVFGERYR